MESNEQKTQLLAVAPGVVAVKAGQSRVTAEKGTISKGFEPYLCAECEMKFYLGYHQAFPPERPFEHYYSELQKYLDQDHKGSDEHADYYYVED